MPIIPKSEVLASLSDCRFSWLSLTASSLLAHQVVFDRMSVVVLEQLPVGVIGYLGEGAISILFSFARGPAYCGTTLT